MAAESRPGPLARWLDALLDRLAGVPADEPPAGAASTGPQRKAARAGAKAQRLGADLDRLAARHGDPKEDAADGR
jgi:hypothetical protein